MTLKYYNRMIWSLPVLLTVNGKKIAYIGEINPAVLTQWELEVPVTAFELNLTELHGIIKK